MRLVVSEIALCAACSGLAALLAARTGGIGEVLTCLFIAAVLYVASPIDKLPDVQVPLRIVLLGNFVTIAVLILALFDLAVPGQASASLVANVLAIMGALYLKMARRVQT
jgi:hypothetical protein